MSFLEQLNDPYKLFNVDENTTIQDIKKTYKKLSRKYHPDKNNGNSDIYIIIKKAYNSLINEISNQRPTERTMETYKTQNSDIDRTIDGMENVHIDKNNFDSDKFNQVFDNVRIDNPFDKGYSKEDLDDEIDEDYLQSIEQSNINNNNFNDIFDSIKHSHKNNQVIKYDEPMAMNAGAGAGFSELGIDNIDDFGVQGQFADFKQAYTKTTFIDPNNVKTTQYNNMEELKSARSNISYNLSNADKEKIKKKKEVEDDKEKRRKQFIRQQDDLYDRQFNSVNRLFVKN
jgi:curved DNA-binding protein CbpA